MKRVAKRKPLPHPWRIALCLLACLALLCFAWFAESMPAFSVESALRRAERQALVPMDGEILANVPHRSYSRDNARLIAVEYGDAAAGFFCAVRNNGFPNAGWNARYDGAYYLAPKSQAGATVMAYPGYPRFDAFSVNGETLTIAVFDAFPQAVRAELSFTLTCNDAYNPGGDMFSRAYALEAAREFDGLFLFALEATQVDELGLLDDYAVPPENYAFQFLSQLLDPWNSTSAADYFTGGAPAAAITFYDAAGNVIATVETEFARALV